MPLTDDMIELLEKLRTPYQAEPIYKDECVFSFDTPESHDGIYVCLESFYGMSREHMDRFSNQTGSKVYLNIKRKKTKVPKKENVEGPEKKVTRLAIGVSGGFDAAGPFEYEIEEMYKIVILPNAEIAYPNSELPTKVKEAIDAVIKAESASRKAELEAMAGTWDGEIRQVSKHAGNLIQLNTGIKIPPKGWKCQAPECDMVENLWLNLTDGSILCGRKFFDGSGGNNHAVEHYAKCKYPLAVKLGTITPDGRADVFSYEEDDMVEDPNLVQHLAHFGINIAQMEKTDKSMIEMEINLNQSMEWNALTEAGHDLKPLYGPGYTGITNLGNSCYLNSVIQLLFSLPTFQNRFGTNALKYFQETRDPANDFNVQMSKMCLGLMSGKYSQSPVNAADPPQGISPLMFRNLVGKGHPEFSTKRQQDAQEFFLHLINFMERFSVNEQSPADCFKFEVEDKVVCNESGQVAYTNRVEYCLPLSIPLEAATNADEVKMFNEKQAAATLEGRRLMPEEIVRPRIPAEACLEVFTEREIVEGFFSTGANKIVSVNKFTRLATFPDVLVIQLKKFTIGEDWTPKKLDVAVDMPLILDLSKLKAMGIQPGEIPMPNPKLATSNKAPSIDELVVSQLMEMGFHPNACRRAVVSTGNCGSEAAMNWMMEHMGEEGIDAPLDPTSGDAFVLNETAIENIQAMGFSREQAMMALKATGNHLERAVDWIFSHPDELNSTNNENQQPQPAQRKLTNGHPKYKLLGFVSHMGTSSMVGHYVAHIEKEGQWVLFNDSKVAVSEKLPRDLGYLYFYVRA